jgi:predicted Mrr-cat superfamily restriction endonuclease
VETETINRQTIGIGYNMNLINMKTATEDEIETCCNNMGKKNRAIQFVKNVFDKFINQIKVGDIVYLCKSEKTILYKAIIDSDYIYDNSTLKSPNNKGFWQHQRKIRNIEKVNLQTNKRMIQTLYKMTEEDILITDSSTNTPQSITTNKVQINPLQQVCDKTKQIQITYFNSLSKEEKCKYIMEKYDLVNTIATLHYYDHKESEKSGNTSYCFSNCEEFLQAINQNSVIANIVIANMGNITFTKEQLIKPNKKKGDGGNSKRNKEKYPIPCSEPERLFCVLNPIYRCNGIRKTGKNCIWLMRKDKYCPGCITTQNIQQPEPATQAITAFKEFNSKANWTIFVEKYYVNNVFNQDLYNKDQNT